MNLNHHTGSRFAALAEKHKDPAAQQGPAVHGGCGSEVPGKTGSYPNSPRAHGVPRARFMENHGSDPRGAPFQHIFSRSNLARHHIPEPSPQFPPVSPCAMSATSASSLAVRDELSQLQHRVSELTGLATALHCLEITRESLQPLDSSCLDHVGPVGHGPGPGHHCSLVDLPETPGSAILADGGLGLSMDYTGKTADLAVQAELLDGDDGAAWRVQALSARLNDLIAQVQQLQPAVLQPVYSKGAPSGLISCGLSVSASEPRGATATDLPLLLPSLAVLLASIQPGTALPTMMTLLASSSAKASQHSPTDTLRSASSVESVGIEAMDLLPTESCAGLINGQSPADKTVPTDTSSPVYTSQEHPSSAASVMPAVSAVHLSPSPTPAESCAGEMVKIAAVGLPSPLPAPPAMINMLPPSIDIPPPNEAGATVVAEILTPPGAPTPYKRGYIDGLPPGHPFVHVDAFPSRGHSFPFLPASPPPHNAGTHPSIS
eukprot:gene3083-3628_t